MHIIPVNSDGVYYGIGANRLEMYLLMGKFDSYMICQIRFAEDQTDSDVHFELNIDEHNNMVYVARFGPRFSEHYEKFMPLLYKAVVERFPNLNIELYNGFISIHY